MTRERAREAGVAVEEVSQVPPGAVTALLLEVARSPEATPGEGWDAALRPGAVIGRFELVREIGRGGFGVVYEARDRELGRSVAFKAVRARDRASLREERLLREAEAAARLSHPNIVTLFDVGRAEHGPYLVLELLRGRTLAERLREGPVPVPEALRIAVEVSRALSHAHAHGVVHRDLTPGNVFLCEDGQVKVLDFGMARVFGQRSVRGGTPAYMAPEQWRGAPEDERTDVFALGVILYRMIAGALPFPAQEGGAPATSPPPPPLDVPDRPGLGALVARMLAADPVERPRDGAEVHAALVDSERGTGPDAAAVPAASAPARSGPPARRRPRWIAAALALAAGLAVAAGVAALLLRRGEAPGAARVTVAVADFENQTGEAELNGLSGMLITSLEQSRRLSVLTRVRMLDVLRQLGKPDVVSVDESLGRELARSAGVRALVLATIRRFDQLYAIELKALDPQTSEYLFTLKEVGEGKRSVPGMIDRLSDETRSRLRETPAEVSASHVAVADATTASFEAWSHYFAGEQAKDQDRYDVAIAEYRRATEVDPGFALAHYRIAYLGEFAGVDAATRREEIAAALQAVQRVPEKERLLILAWKAHMDDRDAEAKALYERAVAAYPEDKEALYMAADLQFHKDRFEESLPLFDRALALDPSWEPALLHAVEALLGLGRLDEAATRAQAWAERAPGGPALRTLARVRLSQGRFEEGEAVARRAVAVDRTFWSGSILAEALLLLDRYDEAEALAREAVGEGAPSAYRGRARHALALVLVYQGRRREAVATMQGVASDDKRGRELAGQMALLGTLVGDGQPDGAREAAQQLARVDRATKLAPMMLAVTGDLAGAAERARDLGPGAPRALYEASVAARNGDLAAALSLVEPATRAPEPHVRTIALWLAAHWALQAGRPAEVRGHLEAFRRIPSDLFRAFAYPRSLLEEARALERLGDRARARDRVERLLALWKRADPDQPLLAEAKAFRERLGRAAASGR